MKLIFDTNILIYFLISKKFKKIYDLIIEEKIQVYYCDELINEFVKVSKRSKFKRYFNEEDVQILINFFNKYCKKVKLSVYFDLCRDKKDNFLLSLAFHSKSDYLITGDKDLLIIKKFKNTEIIKINDLNDILNKLN